MIKILCFVIVIISIIRAEHVITKKGAEDAISRVFSSEDVLKKFSKELPSVMNFLVCELSDMSYDPESFVLAYSAFEEGLRNGKRINWRTISIADCKDVHIPKINDRRILRIFHDKMDSIAHEMWHDSHFSDRVKMITTRIKERDDDNRAIHKK